MGAWEPQLKGISGEGRLGAPVGCSCWVSILVDTHSQGWHASSLCQNHPHPFSGSEPARKGRCWGLPCGPQLPAPPGHYPRPLALLLPAPETRLGEHSCRKRRIVCVCVVCICCGCVCVCVVFGVYMLCICVACVCMYAWFVYVCGICVCGICVCGVCSGVCVVCACDVCDGVYVCGDVCCV